MAEEQSKLELAMERFDAAFARFSTKKDAIPEAERPNWRLASMGEREVKFEAEDSKGALKVFSFNPPFDLEGVDLIQFKHYARHKIGEAKFNVSSRNVTLPWSTYDSLFKGNEDEREAAFQLIVRRIVTLTEQLAEKDIIFGSREQAEEFTKGLFRKIFSSDVTRNLELPEWITTLLASGDPIAILNDKTVREALDKIELPQSFGQRLSTHLGKAVRSLVAQQADPAPEETYIQQVDTEELKTLVEETLVHLKNQLPSHMPGVAASIKPQIRKLCVLQLKIEHPNDTLIELADRLKIIEGSEKAISGTRIGQLLDGAYEIIRNELEKTDAADCFPGLASMAKGKGIQV